MAQYWIVAFGRSWEPEPFTSISVHKPEGLGSNGERLYGESSLCLFDSEQAARGFWQEIREFDVDEPPQVQGRGIHFQPVKPEGLEAFILSTGHSYVVVNPSVLPTQERYFWPTEEFLASL